MWTFGILFFLAIVLVGFLTTRHLKNQMKTPSSGRACPIPKPIDVKIDTEATSGILDRLKWEMNRHHC